MKEQRILNNVHSFRVLDGDTIEVLGQIWTGGIYVKQKVRLSGIDTPEKTTDAGKAVQKYVTDLLAAVKDFKVICNEDDKYSGRFVGHVCIEIGLLKRTVLSVTPMGGFSQFGDGKQYVTLTDYLVFNNLGKRYDGGTKSVWTKDQLREVENNCSGLAIRTLSSSTPEDRWVVLED